MTKKPILIIDNDLNDPTVLLANDCKILFDYEIDENGEIINIKNAINMNEIKSWSNEFIATSEKE
jgi:hypothetical protein